MSTQTDAPNDEDFRFMGTHEDAEETLREIHILATGMDPADGEGTSYEDVLSGVRWMKDEHAKELATAHAALRKAQEALEGTEHPLQFWLEHARADGEEKIRMAESALMTLKARTAVKSALTLIQQTLPKETR